MGVVEGKKDVEESEVGSEIKHLKKFDKMAGAPIPGPRPVFVFPGSLDFYLDDQSTHKRVLTLYNPYDVDILFKVLCNNPKKYAVVEPEGRISSQKCTDIVVRHVAVSPSATQQTDKFRIHIFDETSPGELVGKRDILATLHPGVPDPSDNRHSSSLPHHRANAALLSSAQASNPSTAFGGLGAIQDNNVQGAYGVPFTDANVMGPNNPPNLIACIAAIVCIVALFLPTEGETENILKDYPYLHLTVNQKLVFAYVLGLVTMAILRTT